jgi:hypothetical protein
MSGLGGNIGSACDVAGVRAGATKLKHQNYAAPDPVGELKLPSSFRLSASRSAKSALTERAKAQRESISRRDTILPVVELNGQLASCAVGGNILLLTQGTRPSSDRGRALLSS